MRKPVIFCDFDGTITMNDNIVSLMRHFNPPGWETIVQEIVDGRKSLRTGVGEMFALFPSSRKQEILDYVMEIAQIRGGFSQLLDFCRAQDIGFYVTSGGIDFFVYPVLAPFAINPDHIYCNGSDFSGERIRIQWPHPCDEHCSADCGMCKTRIIRSFSRDDHYRILIGDSLTDFEGAQLADLVFARSHLLDRCRELRLPHMEYDDFYDIIAYLQKEDITGHV